MKLFSQKEVKNAEQDRLSELLKRESQISEVIVKKEKEFNQKKIELEQKIAELQVRYQAEESRFKLYLASQTRTIEALEERRNEALKPVIKEWESVAIARSQLENAQREFAIAEVSLARREENLREERAKFDAVSRKTEKEQKELSANLEKAQASASTLIAESKKAVIRMKNEEKRIAELIKNLEEKESGLSRAENLAKAAIAAADKKITQERIEQKKTVEQRKMLKFAIDTLKKKGLWRQEMLTK